MNLLRIVFLLVGLIPVYAQSNDKSADLLKARQAWTAFECAALASKIESKAEQARLFSYGLAQGRAFLRLVSQDRFSRAEMHGGIPSGFWFVMEGPSDDFVLGRLWEVTVENTLREVSYDEKRQLLPSEIQKIRAQTKFDQSNCPVVGR